MFNNATFVSNLTETPKRNLRASHGDFDKFNNVMQRHEKMFDQIDMEFDRAFNQEIPEDFKKVVKNMKKHHNSNKNQFHRRRYEDDSEMADEDEKDFDTKFDFKREMYRIYAPALYEHAKRAE